jgi:hypothetical protein
MTDTERIQGIADDVGVSVAEVREKFAELKSYRIPSDEIEKAIRSSYRNGHKTSETGYSLIVLGVVLREERTGREHD